MSERPVFNPEASCPKCGSESVNVSFHEATNCSFDVCDKCHESYDCKGGNKAHMVRYCRRCRFEWFEIPLDEAVA